jgi:hypothetical protein
VVRAAAAALGALLLVPALAVAASSEQRLAANVHGTLTRGPTQPVCLAEKPCSAPAPGVVLVFSKAGKDVKRATTDRVGHFALRLSPGTYRVRVLRRVRLGTSLTPKRFRVPEIGVVVLRLELDTGIR